MKPTNALHSKKYSKLSLMFVTKEIKSKYQRIIAPSLGRPRSGSAPTHRTRSKVEKGNITLMKDNNYPFKYKYFDDYNKIGERLKPLQASEIERS